MLRRLMRKNVWKMVPKGPEKKAREFYFVYTVYTAMAQDGIPKWPKNGPEKKHKFCFVYTVYRAMAQDGTPKWPHTNVGSEPM